MEIKIFNFGPIKTFEFDLSKDLVVCYGKNNIGKSYGISVVYLLLNRLLKPDYSQLETIIRSEVKNKKNQTLQKKIREEQECNITGNINNMIRRVLDKVLSETLENAFKNSFGQLNEIKNINTKNAPTIQINVLSHSITIAVGQKVQVKKFSLNKNVFGKFPVEEDLYIEKEDRFVLGLPKTAPMSFTDSLSVFITDQINRIFDHIKIEFGEIYFLPASRYGIYSGMQSLFPIIAELSKSRGYVKGKIELPTMSEPIADYILRLSEIRGIAVRNKGLNDTVRYIEKEILGGEVNFDVDKKALTYSPGDSGLTLNMNSVSSMVAELSPFVAFIKYILMENTGKPGTVKPVIFIEEPEAHLHPEAQVLLAEMFVKLVTAGVKVIVTSHSNYLFNKFSNMLISKSLTTETFVPILLMQEKQGSVSRLMEADELGIEDENFMDTAEELFEEREYAMALLDKDSDD